MIGVSGCRRHTRHEHGIGIAASLRTLTLYGVTPYSARILPPARHGFREMLVGTLVLAVLAFGLGYAWWPLAILVIPVLIWLFAFFRDPNRRIPTEQHIMVSPADGKVSDIGEVDEPLLGGKAIRVGI